MSRHRALLADPTERAVFPGERALIGSFLYLGGALLGVLVSPLLALAIFICLPIFYALTSEGLPARRGGGRWGSSPDKEIKGIKGIETITRG